MSFFILFFKNSNTEYRKLLSGTYEYEYEEYPDEDNFAFNTAQDTRTTTTTSLDSTKKTSTRSNISPTSEKESTQTTHTTEMSTAESTKHYLR